MNEIQYTTLTQQLCQPVARLLEICFPDMPPNERYNTQELEDLADCFPEGTIIALDDDQVVGMGAGVFLDVDFDNLPLNEHIMLNNGQKCSHNPAGAYYYGSDMAVHPAYRGRHIGREIYDRRKALVRGTNRKGFAAAAVLPGFADHKHQLEIHEYIERVVAGELFDPTLSVQLRNGFKVIHLIKDFFIYPRSDNWGAWIFWENKTYQPE